MHAATLIRPFSDCCFLTQGLLPRYYQRGQKLTLRNSSHKFKVHGFLKNPHPILRCIEPLPLLQAMLRGAVVFFFNERVCIVVEFRLMKKPPYCAIIATIRQAISPVTNWASYSAGLTKGGTGERKWYAGGLEMAPHCQHDQHKKMIKAYLT